LVGEGLHPPDAGAPGEQDNPFTGVSANDSPFDNGPAFSPAVISLWKPAELEGRFDAGLPRAAIAQERASAYQRGQN
jgi:hypothetical protein